MDTLRKRKPESTQLTEKLKGNRVSLCEHLIRRKETHVTRTVMNVEGCRGRRRPKKKWMDII